MRHIRKFSIVIVPLLACVLAWGADWLTDGGNSQRTAWQQDEKLLTPANVGGACQHV